MTAVDAIAVVASIVTIAAGFAVSTRYLMQKRGERKTALVFITVAATVLVLLGTIWFTRPLASKALDSVKVMAAATRMPTLIPGSETKVVVPTATSAPTRSPTFSPPQPTATPTRSPTFSPPQPTATPTPIPPRISVSDTVIPAVCHDPSRPGQTGFGLKNTGGGVLHWTANTS